MSRVIKAIKEFFEIKEAHTERVMASGMVYDLKFEPLHHSEPYEPLTGQVGQVMSNRGAGFTAKSMTLLGELLPCTPQESNYLDRIAKPKRRDQANVINH